MTIQTCRRVRPHPFVPDPELSREYVPLARRKAGLGPRRWCARCGLPGEPGDHRHPHTAERAEQRQQQVLAAAAAVDRRRLGEHDHDHDDREVSC